MRKKGAILLALAGLFVLLAGVYLWGPGVAPRGQEPIVSLSTQNFSEFGMAFNRDTNVARLVLLLSPT